MPAIGDLLGGKYRVLAKLGEGGMGIVFEAENVLTGRHVALKWMHPHRTRSGDATERLLREARAGSRLSHPNVCDVYDVVLDNGTLFLVMELLQGETLRDYLRRNPTPPINEFIRLVLPAMEGVAAAHEMSVIHRDLKPDNIFLVRDRRNSQLTAKVVDFGIAKLTASATYTLTETGVALGTPHYMSLEQLRGDKDVDGRADVYAFGVMLYEAITGRMPYAATTLSELAIKVATTDPLPVKALRPDVPTALARLIDWTLARDRTHRLPDIRTLHTELELFAREQTFRDQMTLQSAALPRLASDEAARTAEPRGNIGEPVAQPVASVRPAEPVAAVAATPVSGVPDTFTGRELRGVRRSPRHPVWLIGVAGALLLAAGVLYQSQGSTDRADAPADMSKATGTPSQHAPVVSPAKEQTPPVFSETAPEDKQTQGAAAPIVPETAPAAPIVSPVPAAVSEPKAMDREPVRSPAAPIPAQSERARSAPAGTGSQAALKQYPRPPAPATPPRGQLTAAKPSRAAARTKPPQADVKERSAAEILAF